MFKNLTVFKFTRDFGKIIDLSNHYFVPTGPTDELSFGLVNVNQDKLDHISDLGYILKVAVETKSVPASIIKSKTNERAAALEQQTGRKPGKKERREIGEDIKHELLRVAFPKRTDTFVWFSNDGFLFIDSTSQKIVDAITSLLVSSMQGLTLSFVQTTMNPVKLMTDMLLAEEDREPFFAGKHLLLESIDEGKRKIRFDNHYLRTPEVEKFIKQGALPIQMKMAYNDQLSFVLTDNLKMKKIEYLDGVMQQHDDMADRFDADVALVTGIISNVWKDLLWVLGGEMKQKADHVPAF